MGEYYMVWVWLGLFITTVVIEAITQDLVSVWFAFGAIIALILAAFPAIPWYVQLIVFAFVSLLLLILTRPFAKRLLFNSVRYTNIDEYVGKRVKVISDITKFENGEVRINDVIYSASLLEEETETIKADEIVEIVTFRGNKVVVRKID